MFKCKYCKQKFSFMNDRDLHQTTCKTIAQQRLSAEPTDIKTSDSRKR